MIDRYKLKFGLILIAIVSLATLPFLLLNYNYQNADLKISNLTSPNTKEWTILFYLDADCNLEDAAMMDFNELEMVGSDNNINYLIQIDRHPDYDSSSGDWYDTRRYYVKNDFNPSQVSSNLVQILGELNMGSAETLRDFLEWGITTYPANNYALILWDHGSGIMSGPEIGGICWDDSNNEDYLTISELESALSEKRINLLCFDACLMGCTEINYQLQDYVDVIVTSEETIPGDGFHYNGFAEYLKTHPNATPEELSVAIVDAYEEFYARQDSQVTLASLRTFSDEINSKFSDFFIVLNNSLTSQKASITLARENVLELDDPSYIDLYDFIEKIQYYCSGEIGTVAQELLSAYDEILVTVYHSESLYNAHGLSIYFPRSYYSYSSEYQTVQFSQDFLWEEFLKLYYLGSQSGNIDDDFEENDDSTQAILLTPGNYYNLVLNSTDLDFFKVFAEMGNVLDVTILFKHSQGDLDLFLYDPSNLLIGQSETSSDNENIVIEAESSGYFTIKIDSYNEKEYQLYNIIIKGGIDDAFEQNDYWSEAVAISTGILIENLVGTDPDFYSFTAEEGVLINISLQFRYVEGDLDLYLCSGKEPMIMASSFTATDNEKLLFSANYSGIYILLVYNYESNNNYALKISLENVDDQFETIHGLSNNNYINTSCPLELGTFKDLVCINDDFYTLNFKKDIWINITLVFTHYVGDLDMYLLDNQYRIVAQSGSFTDNEFIYFKPEQDSVFYLWIDDYEMNFNYALIIEEVEGIWDDDYEENDWIDEASRIEVGITYDHLSALDWDTYYFESQEDLEYTITLELSEEWGDLDLYLIEYVEEEDTAYLVESSNTFGNMEQIQFESESDEGYYVLVYLNEINLDYSLIVELQGYFGSIGIDNATFIVFSLLIIIGISVFLVKRKSTFH